jgi:hypothetical protein
MAAGRRDLVLGVHHGHSEQVAARVCGRNRGRIWKGTGEEMWEGIGQHEREKTGRCGSCLSHS